MNKPERIPLFSGKKLFSFHVSFILSFWLVFTVSDRVAAQSGPLANRILIKFESSSELTAIRAKTGIDPQQSVQQMLYKAGAGPMEVLFPVSVRQKIQTLSQPQNPEPGLNRIYEVQLDPAVDAGFFAAKLSSMPGVEYAEPRRTRSMYRMSEFIPDDPIRNTYQEFHQFESAWEVTRGSPEVVIAIVDGGVGYNHPDLENKLWINQAEIPSPFRNQIDQNGDGMITGSELKQWLMQHGVDYDGDGAVTLADALHPESPLTTGGDTDGNGFADDLFGWDFWESGGTGGQPVASDNNPIHSGTDHGTHVAGIAAAEPDNNLGLAGTGFRTRYMTVKTGGIPDNPSTPNVDESELIGFGYEGIVYAALMGADVINCSWGGNGYSNAELDAIEFANEQGAVMVCAAGNETAEGVGYPAGFENTLAVGSIETDYKIAQYSNYGYSLDVLATGTNIRSTTFGEGYATYSGTSLATPVVSGLAALLKAQRPDWSPQHIAGQIRGSATPVENANASYLQNKLGRGSIDAFRAVSSPLPAITVRSFRFVNESGEKLDIGEEGKLIVEIVNDGNSTGNLSFHLEGIRHAGNITISAPTQHIGSLGTNDSAEVTFGIRMETDHNLNNTPFFKVTFADNSPGYEDFTFIEYDNIFYDTMAANNVQMSFGSDGTIGFTDPLTGSGGVGFVPGAVDPDGHFFSPENNLLFEGGLMIGVGETEVNDAVRSERGSLSRDFTVENIFRLVEPDPDIGAAREGSAGFSIRREETDTPIAQIQLQTYMFNDPGRANTVYLKYTLTNPSAAHPLEDLYVGLFNDWDIGEDPLNNSTALSEADSILYFFDAAENSTEPVVAVAHLGPVSSLFAIDNAAVSGSDPLRFGIYDGFTDPEKIVSLQAGLEVTTINNTDVSGVVASGPYTLNPGASITAGFVYAFGNDLEELRGQVASAREQMPFSVSPAGIHGRPGQSVAYLFQNYPNPFTGSTEIRLDLEEPAFVRLAVYDVLGRKISVLADKELDAGTHLFTFNGMPYSNGIYFVRLQNDTGFRVIPMTLIR